MVKTSVPYLKWISKLDFTDKKQGFVALLIGILVTLITGGFAVGYNWAGTWIYWILALGVIVGVLNIFHEEALLFMIAGLTITLMLNLLAGLTTFPAWAATLFNAVIYLLAPASVIVALKLLYALAMK